MDSAVFSRLTSFLDEQQVPWCSQEPMSRHTSLRIGGPAEVMAFPQNPQELAHILKVTKELDITCVILGAGTNILAPDEGCRGLIICVNSSARR